MMENPAVEQAPLLYLMTRAPAAIPQTGPAPASAVFSPSRENPMEDVLTPCEARRIPAAIPQTGPAPASAAFSPSRENPAAQDALAGGRVKISDSYFLVGLNHADADAARNVNLISTRGWFDFPLVLNDDRLAKLTFEKGEAGDHVLSQALSVWKTAENPNAAQPTPAKIAAVLVAGVTRTEGIAL